MMTSIHSSPFCITVLNICLLLSFLNIAAAFAVPDLGSNTTIRPVYPLSRGWNVSISYLTQVQPLKPSSVSGNNKVTVNVPAQKVGLANATSSLATHMATMPSLQLTSLTSSPTKMTTTIPATVVYVTKTEVVFPVNITSSVIPQTLGSHSSNATSPVVALTTAYVTIVPTLKTVARLATSSEYQIGNSSVANLSRSSSSPSDMEFTFGQAPTLAIGTLSSGSRMTNTTTVPSNGTSSAFPVVTQVSSSTSDRNTTMVAKVLSSESRSIDATTTLSTCTLCASSSMASAAHSTSGTASKAKSVLTRVHASRTSEVTNSVSVTSSKTLSVPTTTSQNQTINTSSTSLSSTILTGAHSSRPNTMRATSVEFRTRLSKSSSRSSQLNSNPVTTRTSPKQSASSTTDGLTTILTVSAGNDTIIILPRAAIVRASPTQSTGSTSAAVPTALPPVEPAQHARQVAKIAEIVAPSVVGGGGLSITISWAIWDFLKKKAVAEGKAGVEIVEEQSAVVQIFTRVSSLSRLSEDTVWPGDIGGDLDRVADIENSILQEETINPEILTRLQVAQIGNAITAPPPPPGPLPGDTIIDDPPSTGDPPTVRPPINIKPPKYDDPQSVQFADKLPEMGKPMRYWNKGIRQNYFVRVVPEAYRDLSFDAKIFYASKYGENVWSLTLVYDTAEAAAVGPDNKPLNMLDGLELDSAGNIVSYKGVPVEDLETRGFPKDGSWDEQRAKLEEIRKAIRRTKATVRADIAEQNRIQLEQNQYNYEKNQARIRKMEQGLEKIRKAKEEAQREKDMEAKFKLYEHKNEEMEREKAEKKAQDEADRKAKEEADRKAKEEANQKAKEEADRKAEEEADQKAKEEANRKAKEEADRKAKEEADRKAKEEAEERDREAREKEKNTDTDDPNNINAGLWKHKPLCGPDTPPTQRLRCLGVSPPRD